MKGKMIIRYMTLLCVFSVIFLSGCVGGFIYDSDTPYENESCERIDKLADAIEAGDVEAIYKLLSPYAQAEIEKPKERIREFLEFFEGEMVSAEQDTGGWMADTWNLPKEKEWGGTVSNSIYVKTQKKTYYVGVIDCNRNSDEEKVGINVIEAIAEDKAENSNVWGAGSSEADFLPGIICYGE